MLGGRIRGFQTPETNSPAVSLLGLGRMDDGPTWVLPPLAAHRLATYGSVEQERLPGPAGLPAVEDNLPALPAPTPMPPDWTQGVDDRTGGPAAPWWMAIGRPGLEPPAEHRLTVGPTPPPTGIRGRPGDFTLGGWSQPSAG